MGVVVFVLILLLFQALRLTEFVLVHGVGLRTISQIILYLSLSFLPALFPMSLLFAVLLTYGRLSRDSEIVALRSMGLQMGHIGSPAFLLGVLVAVLSAQTSFRLAPWGNRQFEMVIAKLSSQKAGVAIREGTFSEGFFDMVIYANTVDSKTGQMKNVFIYDERDNSMPLTIIAKSGQILRQSSEQAEHALLRLRDGSIHRTNRQRYTKVNFGVYDINLSRAFTFSDGVKSPQSMSFDELDEKITKPGIPALARLDYQMEYHKRWAIAFACLIFALLGVGLGTERNTRQLKASGMVLSMIVIVTYWIFFVIFETLGRNSTISPILAAWSPNVLFSFYAIWRLKTVWS